jgi:2-succinyl-5-enolpyruvyl-6-hydroxy-3-cyclohexene-1-carboxylate synthase
VLVFTETLSNVYNDNFVNSIDQLLFPLDEKELKKLQPEILLTIGGMIVSKKVKQFFRKFQPKLHWHADSLNSLDTYHCLSHHFNISPQLFFSQFFFLCKFNESEFQNNWLEVKKSRKIKHNLFLDNVEFSDLKVFDIILKGLPERTHLQLSNSSVIRYSQLFDLNNTLQVFCNRGTSGIDGSTSTAIGASFINKDQTVFISGDISFFYDSNALWNKYIKNDFRIIIINNSGGGIFRFIPGPKSTNALDYFETPHKLDAVHLSKMYGFEYASAHNETDLEKELKLFYASSVQPKLLEIFTPSIENDKVLKKYFSSLV